MASGGKTNSTDPPHVVPSNYDMWSFADGKFPSGSEYIAAPETTGTTASKQQSSPHFELVDVKSSGGGGSGGGAQFLRVAPHSYLRLHARRARTSSDLKQTDSTSQHLNA